jgi:hypothetical protein
VHHSGGRNDRIGHAKRWHIASQHASTICYPAIDRDFVHASQEAPDTGLLVALRPSQ